MSDNDDEKTQLLEKEKSLFISDFLSTYAPNVDARDVERIAKALNGNEISTISELRGKTTEFSSYRYVSGLSGIGNTSVGIIEDACEAYQQAFPAIRVDKSTIPRGKIDIADFIDDQTQGKELPSGLATTTGNFLKRNGIKTVADLELRTDGFKEFGEIEQFKGAAGAIIGLITEICRSSVENDEKMPDEPRRNIRRGVRPSELIAKKIDEIIELAYRNGICRSDFENIVENRLDNFIDNQMQVRNSDKNGQGKSR